MSKALNFFVCNLDFRCATCATRHVDASGLLPLALCESATKTTARDSNGAMVRTFKSECSYRAILSVALSDEIGRQMHDEISTEEAPHDVAG